MEEVKVREIRQMIFDGKFKCITTIVSCYNFGCAYCPFNFTAHQHFELFGDNGSQLPVGLKLI